MRKKILLMLGALMGIAWGAGAQVSPVKIWEGTLRLPSYELAAPESAPIFDCDWSYQRARRSVYPYVLNDNMTRNRKEVDYKALYLENEYVELCILPEIGGRLFYAIDKTNGYDIFYHNDVVKPANVGMLGAWISGGVEWNVFHHHRATSHTPLDYKLVENKDGSKTIWVGETELRHRMSWAIGVTLRPGSSVMEISGRLINSTRNDNSMLYWSNVATGVDENYQIIFPQNTEFGTFHCKEYFCHWPVTTEAYTGTEEYKNGIEASWWKNHPVGNSIFVHDLQDDFIAGYDHGRKAGTMLVGNHNIIKGGKFWSWGPNSGWDTKILTDNAGHYIELMAGAYSDNQPDYNWSSPYETKTFSQYWYSLRDIGGVKKGSPLAALNMELTGGKLLLGVNGTEKLSGLTLKVTKGDKTIFSETFDVSPAKAFVKTVPVDASTSEYDLTATLTGKDGKQMLVYTPVKKDPSKPLPAIVEPPLLPSQIENSEECYLVGLRNLQFHNPFIQPTDYFMEVLRRDPGDTRANTQMGVYWRLRGDYPKAASYLRAAIRRQTKDYTRPKDCEAMYNLGLILKDEGRINDAIDTLYRSVWNYTYNSGANYQLAQIYVGLEDPCMALERLDEAITRNGDNLSALNLKCSVLRSLGKKEEARACIDRVLAFDPVNAYATCEASLLSGDGSALRMLMRDNTESYLELAIAYLHNGFGEQALTLLNYIDGVQPYPTVKMWLGYLADKAGDKCRAADYYKAALALPVDYCNPFRLETVPVLEKGFEYAPGSDKLHYYLGNLFYDKQPGRAVTEWKKCVQINPSFAMAWRNLGWSDWKYYRNYPQAASYYRKAIDLAPQNVLLLEEADQVFAANGEDVKTRYELLRSRHEVCVKRYYPLAAEVITGTMVGDYDYVLGLLRNCYFPTREGVASFHDVYVDALLLAGKQKLSEGKAKEAIALYEEAFRYPENHQVFYVDTRVPRDAQIYWMIADAYEQSGNRSKAQLNYKKAAEVNVKKTDYRYWQALALRKLGKKAEADALFRALVDAGKARMVDHVISFYGAEGTTGDSVESVNTKAYYTLGLGELGLGNKAEAARCFEKSVGLNPYNLWSKEMLSQTN